MPTVPGDNCVVCGNSCTKDPDGTFNRFPHTYVHQLQDYVQYHNCSKNSTSQFWKIDFSGHNFRGELPCARINYLFLTNLEVY